VIHHTFVESINPGQIIFLHFNGIKKASVAC
jgi:hypothetical protein